MELNKFTNEHASKMQDLTLDYLFITKDFGDHYQNVRQLEQCHGRKFSDIEAVKWYFRVLMLQHDYFSTLATNGFQYIQMKRKELEQIPLHARKIQNEHINDLVSAVRTYQDFLERWRLWQQYFPNLATITEGIRQEKENAFMKETEKQFEMTKAVMDFSLNDVPASASFVFGNEDFFGYCKNLLKKDSWLLLEPEFLSYILAILEFQTYGRITDQEYSLSFSMQNKDMLRRVRSFAKRNHMEMD